MIEYLRIEISPVSFADTRLRELKIKIRDSRTGEFARAQSIPPDDLVSFFDQIWDCAKKEILDRLLTADKIEKEKAMKEP